MKTLNRHACITRAGMEIADTAERIAQLGRLIEQGLANSGEGMAVVLAGLEGLRADLDEATGAWMDARPLRLGDRTRAHYKITDVLVVVGSHGAKLYRPCDLEIDRSDETPPLFFEGDLEIDARDWEDSSLQNTATTKLSAELVEVAA